MAAHSISVAQARQIAVRAQLLDESRPTDLLDTARRLTLLQIDPTAAVAPNADLVAWGRIGSSYSPADLTTALRKRKLIELRAMIRPREDLALYRADMANWVDGELSGWRESMRSWVSANDSCRRDILNRLTAAGPLTSRDLPDTCDLPWKSTGWTNNRKRTIELFDFDYALEMYKPAAKRKWGYFALPILYGDELVGKLDATADRSAGVLRVDAIHRDRAFTPAMTAEITSEIEDLATWLDADLVLPG